MTLRVIERSELSRSLVQAGVGRCDECQPDFRFPIFATLRASSQLFRSVLLTEDRAATLSLVADYATHVCLVVVDKSLMSSRRGVEFQTQDLLQIGGCALFRLLAHLSHDTRPFKQAVNKAPKITATHINVQLSCIRLERLSILKQLRLSAYSCDPMFGRCNTKSPSASEAILDDQSILFVSTTTWPA